MRGRSITLILLYIHNAFKKFSTKMRSGRYSDRNIRKFYFTQDDNTALFKKTKQNLLKLSKVDKLMQVYTYGTKKTTQTTTSITINNHMLD